MYSIASSTSIDLFKHGQHHRLSGSPVRCHSSLTPFLDPYSVNLPTSHQFIDASVDASLSQPRAFLSSGAMYPQSNRPGGFPHTPQWPASYQRPPTQQYYGQQTPDRREETVPASSAAPSSYTSIAPQAPVYPGGSYPLGVYNATSQPYYQQWVFPLSSKSNVFIVGVADSHVGILTISIRQATTFHRVLLYSKQTILYRGLPSLTQLLDQLHILPQQVRTHGFL